ncbi:MAG: peptidyl-prolyl cis-trans isomerase [Candidatus Eisenbacteria bacterium]|nr:peptidyl-prolyl cis-trans isomerase [Candidatus Eisenbacteria bacterium]
MKSKACLVTTCTLLLLAFVFSASQAVELARVGDYSIASDEYLVVLARVGPAKDAPAKTPEGKREFLDRLIAKRLLSQYFHALGWDTLSAWDDLIAEYARGQYIQALYLDAIPEVRTPSSQVPANKLMEIANQFVDSLQNAYELKVDEKAVALVVERSGVRRMDTGDAETQSGVVWHQLFTDEEGRIPVASIVGAKLTIGEFVEYIENMPGFARPTGGNSDEINLAAKQFGRELIFEHEFNKRELRGHPWFKERIANKREEIIFSRMFMQLRDTCSVTDEEVRKYYDEKKDYYVTPNLIRLATMCFESEDVGDKAARRLAEGEDFEFVAIDLSVYSAQEAACDTTELIDRGGNLALYDALWDKPIGAIAGPVSNDGLWYLGKLLERQGPRLLTVEESAPTIVQKLRLAKADDALVRLIEGLRAKTKIVVNEEALEALQLPQ